MNISTTVNLDCKCCISKVNCEFISSRAHIRSSASSLWRNKQSNYIWFNHLQPCNDKGWSKIPTNTKPPHLLVRTWFRKCVLEVISLDNRKSRDDIPSKRHISSFSFIWWECIEILCKYCSSTQSNKNMEKIPSKSATLSKAALLSSNSRWYFPTSSEVSELFNMEEEESVGSHPSVPASIAWKIKIYWRFKKYLSSNAQWPWLTLSKIPQQHHPSLTKLCLFSCHYS